MVVYFAVDMVLTEWEAFLLVCGMVLGSSFTKFFYEILKALLLNASHMPICPSPVWVHT